MASHAMAIAALTREQGRLNSALGPDSYLLTNDVATSAYGCPRQPAAVTLIECDSTE